MANSAILMLLLLMLVSVCKSENESLEDSVDELMSDDQKMPPDDSVGDFFKSVDDQKKSLEDSVGESMQGMSDWFKGLTDGVKDKSEDVMSAAKQTSESGAVMAKGWAESFGESFSKTKDKLTETSDKMKEAVGDAALNTKTEVEMAAAKLAKHAKDASETMMKMFG